MLNMIRLGSLRHNTNQQNRRGPSLVGKVHLLFDYSQNRRQNNQQQREGNQQTADNRDSQRLMHLGTCSDSQSKRKQRADRA